MQQALEYAEILDVPFAFSSNGDGFLEHDRTVTTGTVTRELSLAQFPSPDELPKLDWKRPFYSGARVLEVKLAWGECALFNPVAEGLALPVIASCLLLDLRIERNNLLDPALENRRGGLFFA